MIFRKIYEIPLTAHYQETHCNHLKITPQYRYSFRDWSLITGRGGYKTVGGAREVLPLRKGVVEKVLAMLKGGAQQVSVVVFTW